MLSNSKDLGWLHSSMAAPSAWAMGPLGSNGSPPLMAFPRARCWPPFSISSTRRILVLSLLTVLCWVSCMLMMSRPTCTVWHLTPCHGCHSGNDLGHGCPGGLDVIKSTPSKTQYIWLRTRQQLPKLD